MLDENEISEIPNEIGYLSKLTKFSMRKNKLSIISESIGCLRALTELDLSGNATLERLPLDVIGDCRALTSLDLSRCNFERIPEAVANLTNLEKLDLSNNTLKELPIEMGRLKKLKHLNVERNNLKLLESSIGLLAELIGKRIETNLLIENNDFIDPQVLSLYRRQGVESLLKYLTECLIKEWGRIPDYAPLPEPVTRVVFPTSTGMPKERTKKNSNSNSNIHEPKTVKVTKQVFGVTIEVNESIAQVKQQQQLQQQQQSQRNPYHNVVPISGSKEQPIHFQLLPQGQLKRNSQGLSLVHSGSGDSLSKEAKLQSLVKIVIGTLQRCISSLTTFKNQVASVTVANEFVPLMARYKSIKEDADKLKQFVDVKEITPSNQDSVAERARMLLNSGLQSLELLFNAVITFLNSSTEQQEILNIGSIVNQIQKKMRNSIINPFKYKQLQLNSFQFFVHHYCSLLGNNLVPEFHNHTFYQYCYYTQQLDNCTKHILLLYMVYNF